MLRGWRFGARSAASPTACANREPARLPRGVAGAFVDRAAIDWRALLRRARTAGDRSLLESLRFLDAVRPPGLPASPPPDATRWSAPIAAIVLVIAATQTACCALILGLSLVSGPVVAYRTSPIVLALAFTAGCVLLGATTPADRRRLYLLATFACGASAFARAALTPIPAATLVPFNPTFRGLFPESCAPAMIWLFAVSFPRVRRFTRLDVFVRRIAAAATALGITLVAVNIAGAYGVLPLGPAAVLQRDHPGNVFWHVFVLTTVAAIGTVLVRARRAPDAERQRVKRFVAALAGGSAPFLAFGIARMIVPRFDGWLRIVNAAERSWIDSIVMCGLIAVPVLSTLAVIADRPFEFADTPSSPPRARVGLPVGPALARLLMRVALGTQRRAIALEERLTRSLDAVRLARGHREIEAVLKGELEDAIDAGRVRLFRSVNAMFEDAGGSRMPAGPDSVLVDLLRETTGPIDLSDRAVRRLLPHHDREWVVVNDVDLAIAFRRRDGTVGAVLSVAARRNDRAYDRLDRWFVTALSRAAAAAFDDEGRSGLEGLRQVGTRTHMPGEPAFECPRCGWVAASTPLPCDCGAGAILAALPHRLAGKFLVERRIGRGGMAVVYLARDLTIDRDVALKTLPNLHGGTMARLGDEARAMARLNHEGLATLYGLERWRRTPVLVVEYFPEGTLADKLIAGPLALASVVRLGVRLAGALDYMHGMGILHRDLKPSNIGLTSSGAPKLLDFGLATLTTGRASPPGGTPAYLPPEAYEGVRADVAFDLWGLSIVLFEAATGRTPAAPTSAFIDPPDLSVVVDASLRAFLARALAPLIADRYPTAPNFRSALIELLRQ